MEFINTLHFETKPKQQHGRISKVLKCLTVHLTMDENFDLLVKKKINWPSFKYWLVLALVLAKMVSFWPTRPLPYWSESHASALELHFLIFT